MSKFWQKKYTSKYTGAEIDAAVAKAGDATKVVANPTLAGTEAALEGLQVGETKYRSVGRKVSNVSELANTQIYTLLENALPNAISTGFAHINYDATKADDVYSYNAIDSIITELTDNGTVNEILIINNIEFPVNLSTTANGKKIIAGVSAIAANLVGFFVALIITPGLDTYAIDLFFTSVYAHNN